MPHIYGVVGELIAPKRGNGIVVFAHIILVELRTALRAEAFFAIKTLSQKHSIAWVAPLGRPLLFWVFRLVSFVAR